MALRCGVFLVQAQGITFQNDLIRYGLHKFSQKGDRVLVGLGVDKGAGRDATGMLGPHIEAISFLEAFEQVALIESFAASPYAATVKRISIGTSHDYAQGYNPPYDFAPAIVAFGTGTYPALEVLALGDMEKLFNGHSYYGKLGGVDDVLVACPALRELSLYGQAVLSKPITHKRLEKLTLWADEIGLSGGPIDPDTVTAFLTSDLPRLAEADFELDEGDRDFLYDLPEAFLSGRTLPRLKALNIDCLMPQSEAALEDWRARRGRGLIGKLFGR